MPVLADDTLVTLETIDKTVRVVLQDSAMPERGIEVGLKLRSVVTRYPGNDTPTTQVMGTEEDDIPLRGQWRDVWLGLDGQALVLVGQMRELLKSQKPCELQWGKALVRRGYVKEFAHTIERAGIIGWKMTFQVDEADEAIALAVPFPNTATQATFWDKLAAILAVAVVVVEVAVIASNLLNAVIPSPRR